jgi:hypothetical protein
MHSSALRSALLSTFRQPPNSIFFPKLLSVAKRAQGESKLLSATYAGHHSSPCSLSLSSAMYAVVMDGSNISPDTISRLNSSRGTRSTWQQQQQHIGDIELAVAIGKQQHLAQHN